MKKIENLWLNIITGIVLIAALAVQTWFYFVIGVYLYIQISK